MTNNKTGYWFAIEMDAEDNDWGTGSYDLAEVVAKARSLRAKYPEIQIAVIDEGGDPVCVDIITGDQFEMYEDGKY